MNTLFRFSLFAACVVVALGEGCLQKTDCYDTTCQTGMVECVSIPGSTNIHGTDQLCTCVHTNQHNVSCYTKSECESSDVTMSCEAPKRHCVDQNCRCEGTGHNHGPHFGGNHLGGQQQTGGQQHPDHHQQHQHQPQTDGQQHPGHHHQQQQN